MLRTTGRARVAHARISLAPLVSPSRDYLLLSPSRPVGDPALIVMLHGCRQTAEEFILAARLEQWVQTGRWRILLPRQTRAANLHGCWNWFDSNTLAGAGETAIVLAAIDAVHGRHPAPRSSLFIAGLSSGAALAATLVCHAGGRFRAAAFHSGLAMGAASSAMQARKVMTTGPDRDVTVGLPGRVGTPSLVIHGDADAVVSPVHADQLTRQMLALEGTIPPGAELPAPSSSRQLPREPSGGSRAGHTRRVALDRRFGQHRQVIVTGLEHAWSGGDGRARFVDEAGPDASGLIISFFDEHCIESQQPMIDDARIDAQHAGQTANMSDR